MRVCTKCKETKPLITGFRRDAKGREGFSTQCKDCRNAVDKQWAKENPDKVSANNKHWRQRHPEQTKQIRVAWADAHPESLPKRKKRWRTAHPERKAAEQRQREAKKRNATPKWANQFFIREAYALARLRTTVTGIKWQVDHIVPLRHPLVQGLHVENNLQVIPAGHNQSKGNRHWPDMP